jgi:hypothetical protein
MPRAPIAVLLLLASTLAQSQADPLRSPACLSALQRLTAAENRAVEAKTRERVTRPSPARDESLQAAQRDVALVCLGTAEPGPPAARVRQPEPVTRVGLVQRSTAAAPPPTAPNLEAAPLRSPPLVTVTGCDAVGCWTSDGTRVQRQGMLLLGPRGFCTQLGSVLNCP